MSLLLGLEPFEKFAVVVVGVGEWWWLRPILVISLSLDLDQAEQYMKGILL